MADDRFTLPEGATNHYRDGEPVEPGEPFTPTETERELLGDVLVPVESDESADTTADSAGTSSATDETTEAVSEDDSHGADAADPDDFTALKGIGPATADRLHESGYRTFDDLRDASVDELAGVQNVSEANAEKIHEQLADGEV
ncbi:helix-hairpin-helix domain-containing protein [Halococcus saccharolyticus]|uniref:Helix-hairpin-helix DNA-binding motif class 1 domain-containing protein n=1 Tax=Halococcus saccharolyticus DSM 5350 TaxID=1227455 RepID=M0MQM5_9EURY|nr:helix-hairpin-helix domain-containing protein [Halococcus saccharolyticus]EMA48002.1 hypothetical protein C449_00980 [Halococcus saccharolyticus DSM 5350]